MQASRSFADMISNVYSSFCLAFTETDMNKQLVSRRHFNALCAALGLSLAPAGALDALLSEATLAADATKHTVRFRDGTTVPAVGQGSWHLGQGRHPADLEEEALRTGISLGMTLIDTSGNYGNGRSEELISHVLAGQRDRVFLVSKVENNEVPGDAMTRACEASLRRLGTDYLDLYLLHWPVSESLFSAVAAGFEKLRAEGKIRAWGVSNFNTRQMEALFRVPDGDRCATNQIPYSLNRRGVERDLLPWCKQHDVPVMAYSPLGGDNNLVIKDRTLGQTAAAHGCSAAAIALSWVIRDGNVIAIPESGVPAHVKENAVALSLTLTAEELHALNAVYPGP
jgi:diketogulonate reductase-like aldo/keto reductase